MQRIHLGRFILVIVVGLTGLTGSSVLGASFTGLYERSVRLTPLIPQQSCYYESYNKRLACVCKSMDQEASLDLKLAYFAYRSGNEIRFVNVCVPSVTRFGEIWQNLERLWQC